VPLKKVIILGTGERKLAVHTGIRRRLKKLKHLALYV